MKNRIYIISALLLCIAVLSSCANGASDGTETEKLTKTTSVTSVSEYEAPEMTTSSVQISETASQTAPELSDTSETPAETAFSEASPDETTDTEAAAATVTPETSAEMTADTTTAKTEPLETEIISSVTEKISTSAPKKTNTKPFELKLPSASGKKTSEKNSAIIDYSNAEDGYIAAAYSGKSEKAKLRVICGKTQYDHDLASDGSTEFFPLMGSGSYTVRVYEQVSGKSYSLAVEAVFDVKIKSETDMYLYPNKYSDFDKNSDCVKKASQLCSDKSGTVEKIAAIFEYVSENITYDKELAQKVTNGLTGYIPDPDRTLKNGKGICFDYSSLMTAMCRSQGIPARIVVGYAKENIYHAWNEIYTEETGWITPELYLKNKGFNIADATFYSGKKDKAKIGEYISDSSNYSALYRY